MTEPNAFVSPEYPVLFSVLESGDDDEQGNLLSPGEPSSFSGAPGNPDGSALAEPGGASIPPGFVGVSLGLLVNGIPSFLATVPVERSEVREVVDSLSGGDVRVAVVGISVDGSDIPGSGGEPPEAWRGDEETPSFPAAFLSLVCGDGRRIGVARIVARRDSASPEEVARYVMKQITRGVQVPDLASAG
jgi:hypothetical protein